MECRTGSQNQRSAKQDDALGLYERHGKRQRFGKHHKWTEGVKATTRGRQRVAREPPSPAQGSKTGQANRHRRRLAHVSSEG